MANKDYETRENKSEESSSSFLLGILIGGLVGAGVAIALAPKSGKEIFNKINNQAGSLKEKTVQLKENVLNKSKTIHEDEEDSQINYISLNGVGSKVTTGKEKHIDETVIRKKLAEAQKALEEEEYKVTH
ncbi:YtxH domain-containing protein [Neobacillus sp. K501]